MHGLDLYGKKWTKVAEVVGTRSTVQVNRSYYFEEAEATHQEGPKVAGSLLFVLHPFFFVPTAMMGLAFSSGSVARAEVFPEAGQGQ